MTFLILHHFPVIVSRCLSPVVSPLSFSPWGLPVVSSLLYLPVLGSKSSGWLSAHARARALNARARAHPLAESPTRGLGPQNGEAQQGRHNGETQTPKTSHINAVPRRQKATPRPHPAVQRAVRQAFAANRHPKATSMASYGRPSLPFASP